MKTFLKTLGQSPWREVLLAFGSAAIGIVAQVFLESYSAPFLQLSNLPFITYIVTSTLFILIAVYSITLWNSNANQTKDIQKRIGYLASGLGVKVTYIHEQRRKHERATQRIRELIAKASQELLVLDYNPLEEEGQDKVRRGAAQRHSDEAELSPERRRYYEEIIEKVRASKQGTFRYRRIIQVPLGRQLSDLLENDPIFRKHCQTLAVLGEEQPEIASLKMCVPVYEGTYIVIDRRTLVLEVEFLGPDNQFLSEGGWFFFDDPTGSLIRPFVKFLERADAIATLVTSADLHKQSAN
jgi:hypothetical protein